MRKGLIILVALACSYSVFAQRFLFENVGVNEGLPSAKINALAQDNAGVVWIGTDVGLVRYDGKTRAYTEKDGMAPGGIKSIHIAEDGMIWCGHLEGGLSVIDDRVAQTVALAEPFDRDVTGIASAGEGGVYVGTEGNGLYKIGGLQEDGSPEYQERISEDIDRVQSMDILDDGIAIISGGDIWLIQPDGSLEEYVIEEIPPIYQITKLFQSSSGALWVGTVNGGAYEIKDGEEPFRVLDESIVMCFEEGLDNEIWIGTFNSGIARVQNDGIRRYSTSNGLHGNTIRDLLYDREGIMLVATMEDGLDIFKGERFLHFGGDDGLNNPHVWTGMEDAKGNIWFGTNGGITKLLKSGGILSFSAEKDGLSSDKVRSIVQTYNGRIWIGTQSGGLLEFDRNTLTFNTDAPFQTLLPSASVTAMIEGDPNELWIGTYDGVIRFETETGLFETYNEMDGLGGGNVKCLYKDRDGSLWIGIRGAGITRYDNGVFRSLEVGATITPSAFLRDPEGKMWVGTEGNGMLILDREEQILDYSEEDGLLSNTIRSLALDAKGNVWVGTNKGANEWRAKEGRFIKYTGQSGFVGTEAKPSAAWATKDGSLWFGTGDGAIKVGKEDAEAVKSKPLVVIHSLMVNDIRQSLDKEEKEYPYDARNFSFDYGAVSLHDPGAVRYQVRLKGYNDDWGQITEATSIAYNALPQGDYEFQVKAMDRTGVWSDPVGHSFSVKPPWWLTWWFMVSAIAVLVIGVNAYTRIRQRQLKLRNAILERKVEERTAEVVEQGKEIAHQKNRVEELLLNILPKNISDELSKNGEAKARLHPEATVMFTDMKGFTQVAEKLTPEELVTELHHHFSIFDDIADEYGLEKIKTIGDSYMVACGIPAADKHHAIKVVLAALMIRELMIDWKKGREDAGELAWSLRIGVHSGPVVAGVVGKRKFAYDIWGDTVNTASRMESSGEPEKLNVSGATWRLVEKYVEGEYRGKVKAKNKGEVDMYFIHRLRPEFSASENGSRPNDKLRDLIGLLQPDAAELA